VLIRNAEVRAEVRGLGLADLRLADGKVAEIGRLAPLPGETIFEAGGGALLPGLHDHHIHLFALAARAASVPCGPPEVATADELAESLARLSGDGWIRGIGYHESVMGLPGARELDALISTRPLRIQHRSGRMWLLNSAAIEELMAHAEPPAGLERDGAGGFTGRLFEEDAWLQRTLGSRPPDLSAISADLAACGVTGVTEMSPRNDPATTLHVTCQRDAGALQQRCWLAGTLALADAPEGPWRLGPAKLHLHEAAFPPFDEATAFIAAAHRQDRGVAIHCVSEIELVFALAAIEEAGPHPGDRIEHASVASPELVARMAALRLAVAAQPHFVFERGDRYLLDVEERHQGDLYRLRSLQAAGIVLAGGSDAPFGSADPWQAIMAAVTRRTRDGAVIGIDEALTPEAALALYLADPADLSRQRRIAVGEPADFCLLDRPWAQARERLTSDDVRATFVAGRLIHDRIDQPPA
jgi:predicted amidohydrolase YtcJ